jgi:hypothetical protein
VNDLAAAVGRSWPAASNQLGLIRRGVVASRREKYQVYYRLNSTFVAGLLPRVWPHNRPAASHRPTPPGAHYTDKEMVKCAFSNRLLFSSPWH